MHKHRHHCLLDSATQGSSKRGGRADAAAPGRWTNHMSLFLDGERHENGDHGPPTEEFSTRLLRTGRREKRRARRGPEPQSSLRERRGRSLALAHICGSFPPRSHLGLVASAAALPVGALSRSWLRARVQRRPVHTLGLSRPAGQLAAPAAAALRLEHPLLASSRAWARRLFWSSR